MADPQFRVVPGRSREDVARLKEDLVRVVQAEEMARRRVAEAEAEAERWRGRARLAVQRGDETLASEALQRARRFEDRATADRAAVSELVGHAAAIKQELQRAQIETTISGPRLVVDTDPVEARFQQLEREAARDTLDAEVARIKAAQGGAMPASPAEPSAGASSPDPVDPPATASMPDGGDPSAGAPGRLADVLSPRTRTGVDPAASPAVQPGHATARPDGAETPELPPSTAGSPSSCGAASDSVERRPG